VDTLTSAPVADVLARLFDEAKATDGPLTYLRNPANGYRTIPLPFGAHRGNEMSVRTA
jgi:hypothetical protein